MNIEMRSGQYTDPFHTSSHTRILAWAEIADAGLAQAWTHDRIPRNLDDAWDVSKRSREYLNAADGELEPRYYLHAHTLDPQADNAACQ